MEGKKKMFSYPKGFHSLYASNWNVARDFLKNKGSKYPWNDKKAFKVTFTGCCCCVHHEENDFAIAIDFFLPSHPSLRHSPPFLKKLIILYCSSFVLACLCSRKSPRHLSHVRLFKIIRVVIFLYIKHMGWRREMFSLLGRRIIAKFPSSSCAL